MNKCLFKCYLGTCNRNQRAQKLKHKQYHNEYYLNYPRKWCGFICKYVFICGRIHITKLGSASRNRLKSVVKHDATSSRRRLCRGRARNAHVRHVSVAVCVSACVRARVAHTGAHRSMCALVRIYLRSPRLHRLTFTSYLALFIAYLLH